MTVPRPKPTERIAVRMAREGVPVQVISRTLQLPADRVDLILQRALDTGALRALPARDWAVDTEAAARECGGDDGSTFGPPEDILPFVPALMVEFDIPRAPAIGLAMLMERRFCARTELYRAVARSGASDPKTLDIAICRLRPRLQPHGLEIVTHYGVGYEITAAVQAELRTRVARRIRDGSPPSGFQPTCVDISRAAA